jgi:hypothetical protein
MIIRDVLFVLGCAAGALLAISQYIVMFSEWCRRAHVISSGSPTRLVRANRQADRERRQGA